MKLRKREKRKMSEGRGIRFGVPKAGDVVETAKELKRVSPLLIKCIGYSVGAHIVLIGLLSIGMIFKGEKPPVAKPAEAVAPPPAKEAKPAETPEKKEPSKAELMTPTGKVEDYKRVTGDESIDAVEKPPDTLEEIQEAIRDLGKETESARGELEEPLPEGLEKTEKQKK